MTVEYPTQDLCHARLARHTAVLLTPVSIGTIHPMTGITTTTTGGVCTGVPLMKEEIIIVVEVSDIVQFLEASHPGAGVTCEVTHPAVYLLLVAIEGATQEVFRRFLGRAANGLILLILIGVGGVLLTRAAPREAVR
ncbi:unnamed protein product [Cuscuta europaea]|uniref:Uncharacterized protein n=1 Tax=Cuscuta europaea TaxID=41803 RepID=A0A9P0YR06_CUSEU|nr:unnamed protein product [Cuscuta europaea]